MSRSTETIVISVGGSLIVPEDINVDFLTHLKTILETEANSGRQFILIAGGGKTSRTYGTALQTFPHVTDAAVDRLGIAACQLNGHLLREIFEHEAIKINPDPDLYQPGSSSDRAAVRTAVRHAAQKVVNLSNISHVYTTDPRIDAAATPIETITWTDFRAIIPSEFSPNLSSPFDPTAAREAEAHSLEVVTMSGETTEELARYLAGKSFTGTRIHG